MFSWFNVLFPFRRRDQAVRGGRPGRVFEFSVYRMGWGHFVRFKSSDVKWRLCVTWQRMKRLLSWGRSVLNWVKCTMYVCELSLNLNLLLLIISVPQWWQKKTVWDLTLLSGCLLLEYIHITLDELSAASNKNILVFRTNEDRTTDGVK